MQIYICTHINYVKWGKQSWKDLCEHFGFWFPDGEEKKHKGFTAKQNKPTPLLSSNQLRVTCPNFCFLEKNPKSRKLPFFRHKTQWISYAERQTVLTPGALDHPQRSAAAGRNLNLLSIALRRRGAVTEVVSELGFAFI